ncbi:uncharacterized protein TRIADDRAFT_55836 [Trichoplax adhaerens]|uniref:Calponin-homology (CH) domain-containing protein n=1 Tax=Trichoplax adhaerens TaxID=10228 RepID=B3RW00_TRIAD|nr:hypothetical protein TRIADDRAFT_55836 [Trichoplax adhaerens]EDV26089.1 hypothetical protein TRIADDRAFT_55836 [Trichoplax adhaerens]|eukprot:XP_002112122.1 hypothetical protein TRIADDRAFT_55836 [Trichoplax adhaerens]
MANTRPKKYQTLTEVYLTWANFHLANRDLKIKKIQHDFCDGILLCHLIELTSNHQLLHKVQQSQSVMSQINNVAILLEFMKNCGIKLTTKPEDIVKGDIRSILSILWAIFIHFDVHGNDSTTYLRTTAQAMKKLTKWCRDQLNITDKLDMKRTPFVKCYQDGKLLAGVIQKYCKLPSSTADSYGGSPNDKLRHFTSVIEAAENQLGIPNNLIRPSDILQGKADEHILLIFLALLKHRVEEDNLTKEKQVKDSIAEGRNKYEIKTRNNSSWTELNHLTKPLRNQLKTTSAPSKVKMNDINKDEVTSEALKTLHQRIHFYKDARLETFQKSNQDSHSKPYGERTPMSEPAQAVKSADNNDDEQALASKINGHANQLSQYQNMADSKVDSSYPLLNRVGQDGSNEPNGTSTLHDSHHDSRYLIENESRKVQQELEKLEKQLHASKQRFNQPDSVTELLISSQELDLELNDRIQNHQLYENNVEVKPVDNRQHLESTAIIENNTSIGYDKLQPLSTLNQYHGKLELQHQFDEQQIELIKVKKEKEDWIAKQSQLEQRIQRLNQQLGSEKEIQLELGKQNILLKEKLIKLEENLQRCTQQNRQNQDFEVDKIRDEWEMMKKNKDFYEDQIQRLVRENTILQTKLDDFHVVKQELMEVQQDFKVTITDKMAKLQQENDQLREALHEVESLRHEGMQFKVQLNEILQENNQLHQQLDSAEQMQSYVSQIKDELDQLELENGQLHRKNQLLFDHQNDGENNVAPIQSSTVATTLDPNLNHQDLEPTDSLPSSPVNHSHLVNGQGNDDNHFNQTLDTDLSTLSRESTKLKEIEIRLDDLRRENKLLSGSLRDTEVAFHSLTNSFNMDDQAPSNAIGPSSTTTQDTYQAANLHLPMVEKHDPAPSSIMTAKIEESEMNSITNGNDPVRTTHVEYFSSQQYHHNPFISIKNDNHHLHNRDISHANFNEGKNTLPDGKGSLSEKSVEYNSNQYGNPFLNTHANGYRDNQSHQDDSITKNDHLLNMGENQEAIATNPTSVVQSHANYDSGHFSASYNGHRTNTIHGNRSLGRDREDYNHQPNMDVIKQPTNHSLPSTLNHEYRLAKMPGNDLQPAKNKSTVITTTTTSNGSFDREEVAKQPFRMEIKVQQEKSNGDVYGGSCTSSFNNENVSSRISVFSEDSYMEFATTTRNQGKGIPAGHHPRSAIPSHQPQQGRDRKYMDNYYNHGHDSFDSILTDAKL